MTVGAWWERLAPLPGGKRLFSWLLWRLVPYTGSVRPYVLELTSGLAVTTGLPASARGIPTTLSITYLKKARGTLTAEARCDIPDSSREAEHDFESVISNAAGEVVARATVRWRIGPAPAP